MTPSQVLYYAGRSAHPFYRHQFACSPTDVSMTPSRAYLIEDMMKTQIAGHGSATFRIKEWVKSRTVETCEHLRIPNLRLVQTRADLVHSAQLLIAGRDPWIVDFENASVFFWYGHRMARDRIARRRVDHFLRSDRCKKILPWTEAARKSLTACTSDPAIHEKTQVLYPSFHLEPRTSPRSEPGPNHRMRILFVGGGFYAKGGVETVRAVRTLQRSLNVELRVVSFVPDSAAHEFRNASHITVMRGLAPDRLADEFERADLFVLPAHVDTFEFVFLEAFARRLPVVSTNIFAIPEIVTHERTGLLVATEDRYFADDGLPNYEVVQSEDHPMMDVLKNPSQGYVDRLADAIATLAADESLRRSMGDAAYEDVLTGRFSCARRRAEVARIYAEALRDG